MDFCADRMVGYWCQSRQDISGWNFSAHVFFVLVEIDASLLLGNHSIPVQAARRVRIDWVGGNVRGCAFYCRRHVVSCRGDFSFRSIVRDVNPVPQ